MTKVTPDGVFHVYIASEGLAPENTDQPIAGESIMQLVTILESIAQTLRLTVDPDLQRSTVTTDETV